MQIVSFDKEDKKPPVNKTTTVRDLINNHHDNLIKFALKHRLPVELADEVVAETWATFFEKKDNFRGDSKIESYIFGILLNKIREEKRKLFKLNAEEDPYKLLESNFNSDGSWAYDLADPCEMLEIKETESLFQNCFGSLTDRQRFIYKLKVHEGMNYKKISELTNMSVESLKVSVHRSRNQVRRCVESKAL